MRILKRLLLSLPFLLIAFGMAAGCHSTIPSLLLNIDDPTGLAPTQLRVTVSVEELETHALTRPEVPAGPLASPQTLRLFMPDEAVGRRVDLTVEALRDDVVVGSAVTVTVLKAVEDTQLRVSLVPSADPEVCDATTCPFGCCDGNVCIEGALDACGAGGGACRACDTTSTDQCVEGACRCGADGPCPAGYQCLEGACAPSGEGQSCTVDAQCRNRPGQCYEEQGTCGENGKCSYAPLPSTEACSDNNRCTEGDHCDGKGACVVTPKVCDAPSNACLKEVGECVNGSCRYDFQPPTRDCNDNNRCTDFDACDGAGTCKGTPKACDEPPNKKCWEPTGTCLDGNCSYTKKQVGSSCGSGDACTAYTCNSAGECVSSPKVTCTTSNPCLQPTGQCNPSTGTCTFTPRSSGTTCGTNNACESNVCNGSGQCIRTAKVTCTTSNPCLEPTGQCNASTGACTFTPRSSGTSCGTNNACVSNLCNGSGQCVQTTKVVCNNPGNPCLKSNGTCNTTTGACSYQPDTGKTCTSSDGCRVNTTCQANGTCGGGTQRVCDNPPNNQCWEPTGTCSGGSCSYTKKAVGTQCGTNNDCKSSTCNSSGQCVSTNINNGEYCGMTCGTCSGGVCSGGCPSGMHCCGDYCEQNGRQCR